uniref:Uncharacterized protein n=1 Tax=Thermogemmatispora argillosa TaxID=2045280 RepID=A0A455SYS5_9CHLR|nr:hypothetical protein KTA_04480 [Thermogemmatispora argillosa]
MSHPDPDGDPAAPRLHFGKATSASDGPADPGRTLLILSRDQLAALRAVLAGYRQEAFQHLLPTPERNERLRQIQALLGRLYALEPPPGGQGWLSLSPEEWSCLLQVLQAVRTQPALQERWRQQLQRLAPAFGWDPRTL